MVQRDLFAGKAGRAAWGPRICSDKVFKWQAFSDNLAFAYFTIKYYWAFKGTQPHNGFFFRDFELFYKAYSRKSLFYIQTMITCQSITFSHLCACGIWSHWFTLSYVLALDLSSCWKCENSQTVQAIFILSVDQQNNFCLCCDKYLLMFWLHFLLSN